VYYVLNQDLEAPVLAAASIAQLPRFFTNEPKGVDVIPYLILGPARTLLAAFPDIVLHHLRKTALGLKADVLVS